MTEHSVLRLTGERAGKKVAHWQSVAVAACEQCGGNRVPIIHEVMAFPVWLNAQCAAQPGQALLLSLRAGGTSLREAINAIDQRTRMGDSAITFLSGPEGGLSPAEEDSALTCGMTPITLGVRVLRAETAALCALAALLVA
jgi:16S rRNA (uracil1498-N3)-methyltransferase